MPHINDAIHAAIPDAGTRNALNEKLLRFYQANGATSNELAEAEAQFLIAADVPEQDIWDIYLRDVKGFAGALDDMRLLYWTVGPRP